MEKKYLPYNSSKIFKYVDYSNYLNTALKNALTSRDLAKDKDLFYNNNPYVSLDRLVFKLKNIENGDLNWVYDNIFEIDTKVYVKIITDNNITKIVIDNQSEKTFIVQDECLKLIDIEFSKYWSNNRKILNSLDNYLIFTMENLDLNNFQYALFKINESEYKILDVVQIKNFK